MFSQSLGTFFEKIDVCWNQDLPSEMLQNSTFIQQLGFEKNVSSCFMCKINECFITNLHIDGVCFNVKHLNEISKQKGIEQLQSDTF